MALLSKVFVCFARDNGSQCPLYKFCLNVLQVLELLEFVDFYVLTVFYSLLQISALFHCYILFHYHRVFALGTPYVLQYIFRGTSTSAACLGCSW